MARLGALLELFQALGGCPRKGVRLDLAGSPRGISRKGRLYGNST